MKIGLGGAQFGLDYGLSKNAKKTKLNELIKILNFCLKVGIDTIDTAISYGNSENQLGIAGVQKFKIITKLSSDINWKKRDVNSHIFSLIEKSLEKLQILKLHGLLLHNPMELISKNGDQIYQCLQNLKSKGIVSKIGISIYNPEELEVLIPDYEFDIVQAPFNLIDRRIESSQWIKKLKNKKIELHVRSIFLQGLLLMDKKNRPKYFQKWGKLLNNIDNYSKNNKMSPLELCLNAVTKNTSIDKCIIGVENLKQLKSIVEVFNNKKTCLVNEDFSSIDPFLINPSNWTLK